MSTIQQKLKEIASSLRENYRAITEGQFFSTSLQTQHSILEILRHLFKRIGILDNRVRVQEYTFKKVLDNLDASSQFMQERMNNISLVEQKTFDHLQLLLRHAGVANGEKYQHAEIQLIEFLFPWLKEKTAIDVGANRGEFFKAMLALGFKQVFAFEPNPELVGDLIKTHEPNSALRIFPYALSNVEGRAELCLAKAPQGSTDDPQLFSTLQVHPLPNGFEFDRKIPVETRSLRALTQEGILPSHAGVLKVDTEGHDLFVLQGMPADSQYEIILSEFWSKGHAFYSPELPQHEDILKYMRDKGYGFSISVVHLPDGKIQFVANAPVRSLTTWGNTFCFRDSDLFEKAYTFMRAILPQTA